MSENTIVTVGGTDYPREFDAGQAYRDGEAYRARLHEEARIFENEPDTEAERFFAGIETAVAK